MLEVLRCSFCHPTFYRGIDAGDGQLPMVNPPENASCAYVSSQLWETVAPNTVQPETSGTSQQTVTTAGAPPPALFREAHFWITSNMMCFMSDEDNSAFDYSTILSRGADRRRTGGPRPSDVLCQYRLLYQVLYLLSASGASASGARFIRDYISRLSYRLFSLPCHRLTRKG